MIIMICWWVELVKLLIYLGSLFDKLGKFYSTSPVKAAILIYSMILGLLLLVIIGPIYPQFNVQNHYL